jgi:MYXO-CTERM domain-containing protein
MRKGYVALIALAVPLCLMATSADLSTWTWDTTANTVSWQPGEVSVAKYSTYTFDVAKFSSAIAAAKEGTSKTYQLTAVSLSIFTRVNRDFSAYILSVPVTSISGSASGKGSVKVSSAPVQDGTVTFSYTAPILINGTHLYTTEHETASDDFYVSEGGPRDVIGSLTNNNRPIDNMPEMSLFSGEDTYTLSAQFQERIYTKSSLVTIEEHLSDADQSLFVSPVITYTYSEVAPEPTTAALALAALVLLGVRRRV